MSGYLCSVCGLHSMTVNACGCLPELPELPAFTGTPGEVGRAVLLYVMASTDRVWSVALADLELADHYSVSVIGGMGGRAADPVVLRLVETARGAIMRAIDVKRSAAREDAKRARAALAAPGAGTGGGGGARVLRPVAPDTRPPGGVGVAIDTPARAAVGWDF